MGETINIGIFKEKKRWTPLNGDQPTNLIFTFAGKKLRTGLSHIHTYADPFLFEEGGELYLLAEIQAIGEEGYINCWRYKDDADWLKADSLSLVVMLMKYFIEYKFLRTEDSYELRFHKTNQ